MTRESAPETDAQLLADWHAGDDGAFARLVEIYQAPLLRHARALLGSKGPFEDVVQDAFLRLARTPPELSEAALAKSPERPLASWLHTVTRNLCMDFARSENRRRDRERDVAVDEVHAGGIDEVDARDVRTCIERELDKLPADQREVLVLRLLGERSYKEIAEITGRKTGTVGWLGSVGLKALGARLEPLLGVGSSSRGAGGDLASGGVA